MKRKIDFLNGGIALPLILFALPLMLSHVLQALYGAVDLMIVGQFASTASVSAVGTGSQFMYSLTSIILGLTTGNTILIARHIGMKDNDGCAKVVGATIKILIVVSLVIIVLVIALAEQIAVLLNAPAEAFDLTVSYIRICTAGLVFVVMYNIIASIYRGVGNSFAPLIFVAVACVVNIAGDIGFVAGLKLEATGAGLATTLAQAVSVFTFLIYVKCKKLPFRMTKSTFFAKGEISKVLRIGSPIALQDFLTSISFLIITSIINDLGLEESASVGIVEKLFVFLSIVPFSFMSALSAFVSQNIGAQQPQRANKALGIAVTISVSCGIAIFLLAFFGGSVLCSIFEKNINVIAKATNYLKGTSFEYIIIAVSFCMLGYFNGSGKTFFVMLQGLSTAFLVRIPLSYVFANIPEPSMFVIGLAVSISAIVSLLMCGGYYMYLQIKEKKNKILRPVEPPIFEENI